MDLLSEEFSVEMRTNSQAKAKERDRMGTPGDLGLIRSFSRGFDSLWRVGTPGYLLFRKLVDQRQYRMRKDWDGGLASDIDGMYQTLYLIEDLCQVMPHKATYLLARVGKLNPYLINVVLTFLTNLPNPHNLFFEFYCQSIQSFFASIRHHESADEYLRYLITKCLANTEVAQTRLSKSNRVGKSIGKEESFCIEVTGDSEGKYLVEDARRKQFGLVLDRIALGADPNAKDGYGWRVLMYVAADGDATTAESILNAGGNPTSKDILGRTAIHIAASHGNQDVLSTLLSAGGDPNEEDFLFGQSPLMLAANDSLNLKCLQLLLEAGAESNCSDLKGTTALMLAADRGNTMMVKEMLNAGADPNARDAIGNTPLMFACAAGDSDSVISLLDSGASALIENNKAQTAAIIAKKWSHPELVPLVVS